MHETSPLGFGRHKEADGWLEREAERGAAVNKREQAEEIPLGRFDPHCLELCARRRRTNRKAYNLHVFQRMTAIHAVHN